MQRVPEVVLDFWPARRHPAPDSPASFIAHALCCLSKTPHQDLHHPRRLTPLSNSLDLESFYLLQVSLTLWCRTSV
jgi:hypothetical protein